MNCTKCGGSKFVIRCLNCEPEALNAEKAEFTEEEKNIIKWWRAGELTLHYKSNYKRAIVGVEKAEPTLKSDEQIQMDYYDLLNREEKAEKYPEDLPGNWGSGSMKAERCPVCKQVGEHK